LEFRTVRFTLSYNYDWNGKNMNEIKQIKQEVNNKINFFKNRKNRNKIIGTIAIIVIALILAFIEEKYERH